MLFCPSYCLSRTLGVCQPILSSNIHMSVRTTTDPSIYLSRSAMTHGEFIELYLLSRRCIVSEIVYCHHVVLYRKVFFLSPHCLIQVRFCHLIVLQVCLVQVSFFLSPCCLMWIIFFVLVTKASKTSKISIGHYFVQVNFFVTKLSYIL